MLRRFISSSSSTISPFLKSFSYSFSSLPNTNKTILDNGIQVVSESRPGQTAAIGVVVNTGSGHETLENNGIAHFLEHLAFKGTKSRSKSKIEIEVENMGGTLNAFTSREHTMYVTKVFKSDINNAVDLLSDIIQNSKYSHEDIEYEKSVVLREMEEVNKVVEEFSMDHMHEIAFNGSSLGYPILGPQSNIESFSRNAIVEYVNSYYTCNRIAIIGVGAIDHDNLVDLTQKYFKTLPQSSEKDIDTLPEPNFIGAYRNISSNISADNYGILAFEGASWSSADMIPLLIMQSLCGAFNAHLGISNESFSNIAHRVASKHHCEKVASFITSYGTAGLVGCTFSSKNNDFESLVKDITQEYANLAYKITEDDIKGAKHRLKASLLMMTDGIVPVCEEIGRQVFGIGRRVPLLEYFERIDMLDLNTLRDICLKHFSNTKPSLVTVGNVNDIDYSKLSNWTSI